MENLSIVSKKFLAGFFVLSCNMFVASTLEAADQKEIEKPFATMSITKKSVDAVNEIINGDFAESVDYLKVLPIPQTPCKEDEETDPSMVAYAYQVLGQHYMEQRDAPKAAVAYCRSLKGYPLNYELTFYLNNLGVKNFSDEDIENALKEILKKK